MKQEIKELRIRIDGLAQLTKELKPHYGKGIKFQIEMGIEGFNSKEIEKATDSLYLAKAWLGKVLGELGENTPYANDGNRKTAEDIEPTADKGIVIPYKKSPEDIWENKNHIEKVDWLRQEIQHVTHLVEQTIFTSNQSREFAIARTNSYNHLCEARFWLGFELGRIKESNDTSN